MAIMSEAQLKSALKDGLKSAYVLYGEESYLVEQYARLIAKQAVGDADDAFNLHRFDGQSVTVELLVDAVEALPLMADRDPATNARYLCAGVLADDGTARQAKKRLDFNIYHGGRARLCGGFCSQDCR